MDGDRSWSGLLCGLLLGLLSAGCGGGDDLTGPSPPPAADLPGRMAYVASLRSDKDPAKWKDEVRVWTIASGEERTLLSLPHRTGTSFVYQYIYGLAWSTDGQSIVLELHRHDWDPDYTGRDLSDHWLEAVSPDGNRQGRIYDHSGWERDPVFSPTRRLAYFTSDSVTSERGLFVDGDHLYQGHFPSWGGRPTWTSDGGALVVGLYLPKRGLYRVGVPDGDIQPLVLVEDRVTVTSQTISSADTLAYVRCENEHCDIWIADSDGTNRRRLTSGGRPMWSPDGQYIAFFRSGGLWVIDPKTGEEQLLRRDASWFVPPVWIR